MEFKVGDTVAVHGTADNYLDRLLGKRGTVEYPNVKYVGGSSDKYVIVKFDDEPVLLLARNLKIVEPEKLVFEDAIQRLIEAINSLRNYWEK